MQYKVNVLIYIYLIYYAFQMRVQLLDGGIQPVHNTQGAAAYDLFTPEPLALQVGLNKVKLKIKIQLPPNTFGSIRCRSSLAKDGSKFLLPYLFWFIPLYFNCVSMLLFIIYIYSL